MTRIKTELLKREIEQAKRIKELSKITNEEQKKIIFELLDEFMICEIHIVKHLCNRKQKEIDELKEENERLKATIKEMEQVNAMCLLLP